ncbi:MAG: hypothetical protein ACD_75C02505G0001 [uncultured bacterium]|nr:MAG: hypothetical protein ACD_75C02505G0001 [uncultured bacterium]
MLSRDIFSFRKTEMTSLRCSMVLAASSFSLTILVSSTASFMIQAKLTMGTMLRQKKAINSLLVNAE